MYFMKISVFIIFSTLFSISALAQKFTVGPEIGFNLRNDIGVNRIADSLIITADGNVGSNQNIYGFFMDYHLNERFNIHTVLSYTLQLNGYLTYNRNESFFGFPPVIKTTTVGSHNINLLLSLHYRLVEIKGIGIAVIAGLRPNFLINTPNNHIEFREGTRHQGLAEIINNMDNTNKNIYVTTSLGAEISYWRFHLKACYDVNVFNSSYTDQINYYNENYVFHNRTYVTSITLRYDLFKFKSK